MGGGNMSGWGWVATVLPAAVGMLVFLTIAAEGIRRTDASLRRFERRERRKLGRPADSANHGTDRTRSVVGGRGGRAVVEAGDGVTGTRAAGDALMGKPPVAPMGRAPLGARRQVGTG